MKNAKNGFKKLISYLLITGYITGCSSINLGVRKNSVNWNIIMRNFNKACGIKYKKEPKKGGYWVDYWQTPKETKRLRTGDCEDKVGYLEYLLEKDKIKQRRVIGIDNLIDRPLNPELMELHHWVEIKINKEIYVLDPTYCIKIKKDKIKPGTYIELDKKTMKKIKLVDKKTKKSITLLKQIEFKFKDYYKRKALEK